MSFSEKDAPQTTSTVDYYTFAPCFFNTNTLISRVIFPIHTDNVPTSDDTNHNAERQRYGLFQRHF